MMTHHYAHIMTIELYEQIRMYYRSGTGIGCCIGAHAHRHFVSTPQAATLFWRHDCCLEIWHQIKNLRQISNPTPSIYGGTSLPNFTTIWFEM